MTLTVDQGDDEVIVITVLTPDGDAADLTDCTLAFAIRPSKGSDVVLIAKSTGDGIEVEAPATNGIARITLVPADTADLDSKYLGREMPCELDATDSVGKEITLARDTIVINRDLVI